MFNASIIYLFIGFTVSSIKKLQILPLNPHDATRSIPPCCCGPKIKFFVSMLINSELIYFFKNLLYSRLGINWVSLREFVNKCFSLYLHFIRRKYSFKFSITLFCYHCRCAEFFRATYVLQVQPLRHRKRASFSNIKIEKIYLMGILFFNRSTR